MGEIAKKSAETLTVRVAMNVATALGAIVVARLLGPSGKGLFTYAGTILSLVLTATVGHYKAVLWQCGKLQHSPAAVIRVMTRIAAVVSIPVAVALVFVGLLVPSQVVLVAVAAAVPFAVYAQAALGVFLFEGNVRAINLQQMFPTVLTTLAYVPLLLFVNRSIAVPLAALAAGHIASAGYTAWALRQYRGDHKATNAGVLTATQIGFGGQACLSSLAAFLNFRIDVFLVMFMLGSGPLGVYSIGIGLGEFLWQLSNAMINPSLKYIGGADRQTAVEATAKCVRHSLLLVLTAAVFLGVLAPTLIPMIYGSSFAYGATVTRALLPGIVSYSMMPALSAFFSQQMGRPSLPLYFSIASTIICGVATALTLPHFGIIAGAVATSVSYTVAFAAATVYFVRHAGVGAGRIFSISADDLRPYRSILARCVGSLRGA